MTGHFRNMHAAKVLISVHCCEVMLNSIQGDFFSYKNFSRWVTECCKNAFFTSAY